jgi:hypothetical protein
MPREQRKARSATGRRAHEHDPAVGAQRNGYYTEEYFSDSGVEIIGLYWHFVDLVWIILFTIVYLI